MKLRRRLDIIEEGLSYGIYTATVEEGARPIIIHPDGDLTINYLDTKGLPLTPDHLSAATALVPRMIGTSTQEDKEMLRQAQTRPIGARTATAVSN